MREVERLVHAEIQGLLDERGLGRPVGASDVLTAGLGLNSLQLVGIAERLALRLGADPFARSMALTEVRTVGDLCQAFHAAVTPTARSPLIPPEVAAARRRAEARRRRTEG